ncbi:MAG: RHS repeat-associated core domain-containing protein [Terriglobia bacterium]
MSETVGPLNPVAISTQTIYDRSSRVVQRIEDDLATTATQYDGVNREVRVTDPQGNTTAYTYDANDNEVQKVETELSQKGGVASEAFTGHYQYDNHDRLTVTTDNCGNTRQSAYDSRDNLTDATDAKYDNTLGCPHTINNQGNSMRYAYDGLSRRLQATQDLRVGGIGSGAVDTSNSFNPSGHIVTTTVYDVNSRVTALTDNNGNATSYTYDALNRKTSETLADGTASTYAYDTNDNLVKMIDNNGSASNNTYDAINRLILSNVTPAAGVIGTTQNTYQYDGLNRTTQMTDNNDPTHATSFSKVDFAYDSLGRVVEETQNGHSVDGAWVAQAQRTALTYPNNRQVDFTYDSLERIQTIADNGASSNIAQYTYIGPQRVLQLQYQNGALLTYLDNSGTTDIGYDGDRRTVQLRHLGSGNSLLVGFTYNYDREDNKRYEEKLHSEANSELYTYDSAYRITGFQRRQLATALPPPSKTQNWTLDGMGNWRVNTVNSVAENRGVNSVNEYTSINSGPLVYDRSGNLTNDGTLGYQYDYRNRLQRVCALNSTANCTASGAVLLATYSYDAMNRRTQKVVTNSGSLNGTTSFYYDGWRAIEERNGSNAVTQQYVFGIHADEPLTLDHFGGQRLFYHQNSLGSVFALTDTSGAVQEGYEYDAYGQQTVFGPGFGSVSGTVSALGNPYMFAGQRFDSETGLMYFKNRYYSLPLGRFMSRDPVGYARGDPRVTGDVHWILNLYLYGLDDPTRVLDSLGTLSTALNR